MKRTIVFIASVVGVVDVMVPSCHADEIPIAKVKFALNVESHWRDGTLVAQNLSSANVEYREAGEYGNHVQVKSANEKGLYGTYSFSYWSNYKAPVINPNSTYTRSTRIDTLMESVQKEDRDGNTFKPRGYFQAQWLFHVYQKDKAFSLLSNTGLWRENAIRTIKKPNTYGIKFDAPKSSEVDPADLPDPPPPPVPPAKMLSAPTAKGFSQTLAAVVDAPQADLAFLLLNGPQKPLVVSPLRVASQGNTFSVSTPDGKEVADDLGPKADTMSDTLKPGELKIWKVNIKKWFDDHKLTQPGFYALTWTCQGQKSEPFNLYVPTPEEKARLDKEAAQRQ